MDTSERLEKVEKRLKRTERYNRLLLAVILLAVVVMAVGAAKNVKVVKANTFQLVDEKGKLRSILGVLDDNGKDRVILGCQQTKTPDGKTITYPESSLLLFGPDEKRIWAAP